MKEKLFRSEIFKKYSDVIRERNAVGITISFSVYIGVMLLRGLVFAVFHVGVFDMYSACFCGAMILILFFFRILKDKRKNYQYLLALLGYIDLMLSAFFAQLMAYTKINVLVIFILTTMFSACWLIVRPIVMIMGQLVVLVAISLAATFSVPNEAYFQYLFPFVATTVVACVSGVTFIYIRIENLILSEEYLINSDNVGTVIEKASVLNKSSVLYSPYPGSEMAPKRLFDFTINISKERVERICADNIWGINSKDSWDVMLEIMEDCAGDSHSKLVLHSFFDKKRMLTEYSKGHTKLSCITSVKLADGSLLWTGLECLIQPHFVTGDVLAVIIVEDINEDRMLSFALNALIGQNYNLVLCLDLINKVNVAFKVSESDEIKGTYVDNYQNEINHYIEEATPEYERERIRRLMDIEAVFRELNQNGTYEFMVDEKNQGNRKSKALIKYSYMDKNHQYILVMKQDITEVFSKERKTKAQLSRALKEAESANEAKSEFMTKMSHEMRTPLNAILGIASLIEDEVYNPEMLTQYIDKLRYSGNVLLQLINDVLDMSKIEENKFELNYAEYSFSEFWEAIDMMIRPLADAKEQKLELISNVSKDVLVKTDSLRVTQIFINLLANAIKFTPRGGNIVFKCEEISHDEHRIRCRFEVSDNGIGMSEDFQKHLFEPFAQESRSVHSDLNGTGLGLPIVHGIVECLGGTINVKSTQGEGSTFVILLDFERIIEPHKVEENNKEMLFEGKNILIVEDNDINREIAVAILEKKKAVLFQAVNGAEAVEMFAASKEGFFDAVLMDVRMPVMNGLEATEAIRSMDRTDAKEVPIIAMTANAFKTDVQSTLDAGMNVHLSKPIDPKILYETLGELLG